MPDFQGTNIIKVQPGDDNVPYRFTFTVCSAADANDGALPFGTTISSYALTAHKHGSSDVVATTDLIVSDSRSGLVITVLLQYPNTNGVGRYDLEFVVTLDDGSVMEFDFCRVIVKDT